MSLAFVRGIHRWPVDSPHKWPILQNMFPFDDVIMCLQLVCSCFQDSIIAIPMDEWDPKLIRPQLKCIRMDKQWVTIIDQEMYELEPYFETNLCEKFSWNSS